MSNTGNIGQLGVKALICEDKKYLIPDYQRGYRWRAEEEVHKLLDDIANIQTDSYCLQPIVVKKHDNDTFEVIDGQQRLTTLYLICKCLGGEWNPKCTISYATRQTEDVNSAIFLENINKDDQNDKHKKYADYYFMYKAFKEIKGYKDNVKEKLDKVIMIWYEIPEGTNPIEIFDRLNSYRIALTDAELIRALFLKKGQKDIDENRQFEMATEWDQMERELRDSSFWYFLTSNEPSDYTSRLELIFCLMAGKEKATNHDVFDIFEKNIPKNPYELWQRVCNCYTTLRSWYKDHELYHLIGYLVALDDPNITMPYIVQEFIPEYLLNQTKKNKTQKELREEVKNLVKDSLTSCQIGEEKKQAVMLDSLSWLHMLSYEDEDHRDTIQRVLLLFNVLYYMDSSDKMRRFPFDLYKKKDETWSLEHIHPQNPKKLNIKNWWEKHEPIYKEHKEELQKKHPEIENIVSKLNEGSDIDQEDANLLFNAIMNRNGVDNERHGLGNMALLQASINSSLQNDDFSLKCKNLLQKDANGVYLPPCTRNAFLKYYTIKELGDDTKVDMDFWTASDREHYMTGIKNALKKIFTSTNV